MPTHWFLLVISSTAPSSCTQSFQELLAKQGYYWNLVRRQVAYQGLLLASWHGGVSVGRLALGIWCSRILGSVLDISLWAWSLAIIHVLLIFAVLYTQCAARSIMKMRKEQHIMLRSLVQILCTFSNNQWLLKDTESAVTRIEQWQAWSQTSFCYLNRMWLTLFRPNFHVFLSPLVQTERVKGWKPTLIL